MFTTPNCHSFHEVATLELQVQPAVPVALRRALESEGCGFFKTPAHRPPYRRNALEGMARRGLGVCGQAQGC